MKAGAGEAVLVVEIVLLLSSLFSAVEWGIRRYLTVRHEKHRVAFEIGVLAMVSLIIFVVFWQLLFFKHAFLALALGIAWASALLFPMGTIGFYLVLLFVRPWEVLPSIDLVLSLPKAFAVTVIISWLYHKIVRRDEEVYLPPSILLYFVMLLWIVVSGIAVGLGSMASDFVYEKFFPISVVFFLLLQMPKEEKDLRFLQIHLVIALTGVLGSAAFQTYGVDGQQLHLSRLRADGLFGNSNDLASLVVLVVPMLFFSFILKGREWISKYIAVIFGLFFVIALWLTQSRGAFLAVFVMGVSWFFLSRKQSRLSSIPFLLIPLVLSLFIFRGRGDLDGSSSSRMNYVIAGLRMTQSSPIFGVGVSRYPELYEMYTPSFQEWGKRAAHSSWILVLSETGVPGFLLFVGIFGFTLREALRLKQKNPEYVVTLFGYGVTMSLLSHTYLILPYVLVGLIGAAARIQRKTVGSLTATAVAILVVCKLLLVPHSAHAELLVIPDLDKPFGATHPRLEKKLSLIGAKGEVLAFFVRLPAGNGCGRPEILFGDDKGKDKERKASFQGDPRFFYLPYVPIVQQSFPGAPTGDQLDPVVPLWKNEICLAPEGPSWILGEIEISPSDGKGSYSGRLSFLKDSLPISLQILPRRMPLNPSYPIYTEMTTWYNLLGHFGKWNELEDVLAKRYLKLLRKHRVETLTTAMAVPKVISEGGKRVLDLKNYPSPQKSFAELNLIGRLRSSYVGFPTIAKDKVGSSESIEYLRALENTLPNLNRPGKAFFYAWDEPRREEFPLLKKLLRDMKTHAESVRVMVTTPYEKQLHSLVDIFVPVAEEIGRNFPSVSRYQTLKKEGKEFWWYVSCMSHGCEALADSGAPDLVIDRPSVYVRSIGWIGPLMKTDAFLYYHVNHGYQHFPKRDPWVSLWDFSGNGDGTLFYPGRPGLHGLTEHQPIASLRLKLLRQASYDAEYIRWMEDLPKKPEWWTKKKRSIVKNFTEWNRDYWAFNDLRSRAAKHLISGS